MQGPGHRPQLPCVPGSKRCSSEKGQPASDSQSRPLGVEMGLAVPFSHPPSAVRILRRILWTSPNKYTMQANSTVAL